MPARSPEAILAVVRAVTADTFGCSLDAISGETSAVEVDGWDSLSHTQFLAAIEQRFQVQLDLARVVQFQSLGDLVQELARVLA